MTDRRAHWSCELSCFSGEPLGVESARVTERMDEPFEAEIVASIPEPDVDLSQIVGCDCVLRLERPASLRRFVGVVREVQGRRGEHHESTFVRLTVVPALALLGLRRDTRIFQGKSVPEVLEEVLGAGLAPYGREVTLDLHEEHPVRDYFLQYQETDLDFAHRLMEEEGISYSFDTGGELEQLVLRDVSSTYPDLETGTGRAALTFDPHLHEAERAENVYELRRVMRPTIGRAAARGRDFTGARRVDGEGEDDGGRPDREEYEHRRGRLLREEGEAATYARRGLEAARARGLQIRGSGRAIGLAPGRRFDLEGHPVVGLDARYFVTEVVHRTVDPAEQNAPSDGYAATFSAIPADLPWRPLRRTPKPRVGSVETATVVGPGGEEIHTDEHGRVKVQFHWDRAGGGDEHSSCWLRVRQAWAGAGFGFLFIPRIGMEVVVMFLEGDPDRPVVGGCLYNAANPPPYSLPDEKTKSTIKTNSSPGGGGFNELRFEDLSGQEQIYTHAQKDQDEVVENDHSTWVGNDQTNEVTGDQLQKIGRHQVETVHVDQEMTVMQKRTVKVTGTFTETVNGNEKRIVTDGFDETITGDETRKVDGGLKESRLGAEKKNVMGGVTETIQGDLTQTIVGSSTEITHGPLAITATGAITVNTLGKALYSAAGPMVGTFGGPLSIAAPPSLKWNTATRTEFEGLSTSSKGISVSITGLNTGTAGTAIGMAGVSLDFTQIKVEAWGGTVGVQNLAVSLIGASASATGVIINVGAFEKTVAGLFAS